LHKSVFDTFDPRFYWFFDASIFKKGVYATASFDFFHLEIPYFPGGEIPERGVFQQTLFKGIT